MITEPTAVGPMETPTGNLDFFIREMSQWPPLLWLIGDVLDQHEKLMDNITDDEE